MSIPVELDDLVAAASAYGFAYVLTVSDAGTPHVVAATPQWGDGGATVTVGRSTLRNVAARPSISLCYPPAEPGGYSLISDGTATVAGDDRITFAPTTAVYHRPAPGGAAPEGEAAEGCVSDCAPVSGEAPEAR
mgnify:CR=1 FL=1